MREVSGFVRWWLGITTPAIDSDGSPYLEEHLRRLLGEFHKNNNPGHAIAFVKQFGLLGQKLIVGLVFPTSSNNEGHWLS